MGTSRIWLIMSDVDEPDGQKSTQNFIIIDTEGQGILLQSAMEWKIKHLSIFHVLSMLDRTLSNFDYGMTLIFNSYFT